MADTSGVAAVAEPTERSKPDTEIGNDHGEVSPVTEKSALLLDNTGGESNIVAVLTEESDAAPPESVNSETAVTDATPASEHVTREPSIQPNDTESSQPAPEPAITENPEVTEDSLEDNSVAKNASEDMETTEPEPAPETLISENPEPKNLETSVTENPHQIESQLAEGSENLVPIDSEIEKPVAEVIDNPEPIEVDNSGAEVIKSPQPIEAEKPSAEIIKSPEPIEVEKPGADVMKSPEPIDAEVEKLAATDNPEQFNSEMETSAICTETSDSTQEKKSTLESETTEGEQPIDSVEAQTSEPEGAGMEVDDSPSTRTDYIQVKLELEENTERATSQEPEVSDRPESESVADSTTPVIKSEINEAVPEDVEMSEAPQNATGGTEPSTTETDTRKDQLAETVDEAASKGERAREKMNGDEEMADGERTVTMLDVLQEQADLEDNADAVLGASDDNNCTYEQGYIKRQAVYACLTCCFDAKVDPTKRAGVCLACSLTCHENHDLVELYTKRNFRCDCGNPNFKDEPCTYTKDKPEFNVENKYNQNFSGLYCICHRPYPDPESSLDDEMIQCIVCEDWLHATHLDATVPANDQYSEMICKLCMEKNEFLHDYTCYVVNVEENEEVHILNGSEKINGINYDSMNSSELAQTDIRSTEVAVEGKSKEKPSDENNESTTYKESTEILAEETSIEDSAEKTKEADFNEKTDVLVMDAVQDDRQVDISKNTPMNEEFSEVVNNTDRNSELTETASTDDANKDVDNEQKAPKTVTEETGKAEPSTEASEKMEESSTAVEGSKPEVNIGITPEQATENVTDMDKMADGEKLDCEKPDIVAEKSDSVAEKSESVAEKSESVAEKSESVADKQDTIEETPNAVADKLDTVAKNTDTVEEKPESVAEKSDSVAKNLDTDEEKSESLEKQSDSIAENSDNVEEKSESVAEKSDSIAEDSDTIEKPETEKTDTLVEEKMDTTENCPQVQEVKGKETSEGVSDNAISEKMLETASADNSEAAEKVDDSDVGVNPDCNNENTSEDVDNTSAAESQTKSDETSEGVIDTVLMQTEENTDQHSKAETSEIITNNANQDVEMAESEAVTLRVVTDEKIDTSEISVEKTPVLDTDKVDDDVEMKEDTVSNMNEENILQQEKSDTSSVPPPENNEEPSQPVENNEATEQQDTNENTNKRKLSTDISEDPESVKRTKLDNGIEENDDGCKRPKLTVKKYKGATFWPCSWRQKLCSCHNCVSMYRAKEVLFLLDLEDTVSAYEDLGKAKTDGNLSQYEKGLRALSSLDRIQQINALTEYNKMKDELLNFLISFKNRQEVVKVEDIEKFFADIKPKRKPDGVYFCR